MPYTVTINIAGPGTALKDGGTSLPGHIWYSISDGKNSNDSYGFSPIKHGDINGPGQVTADDKQYVATNYSRTMKISEEQFYKLKDFGDTAKTGSEKYTSLDYKDVRHNCVDFAWGALNHAGLHTNYAIPHALGLQSQNKNHEGSLKPINNVDDIKRITAPFPNSFLNKETELPLATDRTILQRLLSEELKENRQKPTESLAQNETNSDHAAPASASNNIVNQRIIENLQNNPIFVAKLTQDDKKTEPDAEV